MEKKELIDTFTKLETQAQTTIETLNEVKEELSQMTEENHALRMENQHLRDRLAAELRKEPELDKQKAASGLTKSRLNLENIYEDGFHVCNLFFGQRRVEDESCAFCLEVIYGERRK